MSERKIVVPEGMLKAAGAASKGWDPDGYVLYLPLEAALQWLSENPIVPTAQDSASMAEEMGNILRKRQFSAHDCITFYATEWQRCMFLTTKSRKHYDNPNQPNSFYARIEPGVRSLVKMLRNNGFNTTSSCEHENYVECDYSPDGQIKELHDLLYDFGLRDYEIVFTVKVVEGHCYNHIRINFAPKRAESHPLPDATKDVLAGVTYFIHKRDGSMEVSIDPYWRDYVSYQDFTVLESLLKSATKTALDYEAIIEELSPKPLPAPVEPAQTFEEWWAKNHWCTETDSEAEELAEEAWNTARQVAAPVEEGQTAKAIDDLIEAAGALSYWSTFRDTSQETIDYWKNRLELLKKSVSSPTQEGER